MKLSWPKHPPFYMLFSITLSFSAKSTVCSSSSSSCSTSCFRWLILYLTLLPVKPVWFLFRFSFSLAITKLWSDATSAPFFALTSCKDLLNHLFMQTWSVWLCFFVWRDPSCCVDCFVLKDTRSNYHTVLCTEAANLSPFSFMIPGAWMPIICSYPVLSEPIMALRSRMRMVISFW